jgi:hypothetical protein
MFNIQCEDLMMLRFSNTESSIHFKILSLGEALCRLNWMSYKIKQQFNDGVRCDDSVWFYTSSNTLL